METAPAMEDRILEMFWYVSWLTFLFVVDFVWLCLGNAQLQTSWLLSSQDLSRNHLTAIRNALLLKSSVKLRKWCWSQRFIKKVHFNDLTVVQLGNSCDSPIGSHFDINPPSGHRAQMVYLFRVWSALQKHVKSGPESMIAWYVVIRNAGVLLSDYQNPVVSSSRHHAIPDV